MIKRGPVAEIIAGTVHPGRYLVLVTGEVGAVEEAVAAGVETAGGSLLDRVFLPDVHPAVADAVRGERLLNPAVRPSVSSRRRLSPPPSRPQMPRSRVPW